MFKYLSTSAVVSQALVAVFGVETVEADMDACTDPPLSSLWLSLALVEALRS